MSKSASQTPVVSTTKVNSSNNPSKTSTPATSQTKINSSKDLSQVSTESEKTIIQIEEDYDGTRPDFIYGGPFIKVQKPEPLLNTATPLNLQLQGTFKKSFAYYSLKERLPVILTKIIDQLSKEPNPDSTSYIQYIAKLKNELVTNKVYEPLTIDTPEAKRWNEWIDKADCKTYFTNTWVFSECYVYRRLREGCELIEGLNDFDPFAAQKEESFTSSLEAMCVVADRLVTMLPKSEEEKRKVDFVTLLKICLWANKCDLSLTLGNQVAFASNAVSFEDETLPEENSSTTEPKRQGPPFDPFKMIIESKDKLLVDDSNKIAKQIVTKAEKMAKAIEADTPPGSTKPKSGKKTPPSTQDADGEIEQEPKIPCPTKITVPPAVMFDIVCDNAGYELFTDLCLAHFLISQEIVQKVRFHLKAIPWFVSDVTPRDFKFVINACRDASYSRELPPDPVPPPAEGEAPQQSGEVKILTSDNLRQLGDQWSQYLEDGTFVIMSDDFWTSPHVYKDMKKYDYFLYRKLQYAVCILFKGDLNYRKLLGEKNWNPVTKFQTALQGFQPAPIIALRTVKADLICGLKRGKWQALNKLDEKWMEKGDYGVIQFCPKAPAVKTAEKPCIDYGDTCRGVVCPKPGEKPEEPPTEEPTTGNK